MTRIVLFNKPYGVLPQFTDTEGRPTLAEYLPLKDVYPAGRLDRDSEGLLLLTSNGTLQHRISHPRHKLPKTYWVQVEGIPDAAVLEQLRRGVTLNDGITAPAAARLMEEPALWSRTPPIRTRAAIPTAWLELTIREGRNRQVRRMTAAVGHPTLRLVRHAIGPWTLGDLQPGQWREVNLDEAATAELLARLFGAKTDNAKRVPHGNMETPRHRRNRSGAGGALPPGRGRGGRPRGV